MHRLYEQAEDILLNKESAECDMNEYSQHKYSITTHIVKLYEDTVEHVGQPPSLTPQNFAKVSLRKYDGDRMKWSQFSDFSASLYMNSPFHLQERRGIQGPI